MVLKKLRLQGFNWKYILGEILLIFLGINLAVWFNNWNTSKAVDKNKALAIAKIEGEIKNNLEELLTSRQENQAIPLFMEEYNTLTMDSAERVIMIGEEMDLFRAKYSDFFKVLDSLELDDNKFAYSVDTFIHLEIAELSEIALETSKTAGVFNEFDFDCLYGLESTYNLQALVNNEYQNAVEALQNESIEKLLRVLVFIDQLDGQLEVKYRDMLENLDNCK